MICKRKTEARSRNHRCREKAIIINILGVSVAIIIQHAKRMSRSILSSVASPAVQNFPTLSHERQYFREKVIEYIKCVF
jgi:hypothetical protein